MPSGHIFGSFDNKPVGHKAVSELLFYGSVYRTYRQWNNTVLKAPFPCSESCSLSDTQASTLTCKCTSVPRIHSHTQATCTHCETNEGNSSPSIPFHGEACWLWRQCVFTLVSNLIGNFRIFVLAVSLCTPAGCLYLHHCVSVCICRCSCLCNAAQRCCDPECVRALVNFHSKTER